MKKSNSNGKRGKTGGKVKWTIHDENSATGTFVMLNDSVRLKDGMVLQMGVTEVTVGNVFFLMGNDDDQHFI